MSLLITSNTALSGESFAVTGLNTPSSYVNHLQGTLAIPPFSKIAVQSVKINKTGNISISSGNTQMGFYFGRSINTNLKNDRYDKTSFMETSQIGRIRDSYSVSELAFETSKTLNKLLWHPNLLENASATINPGASCIVQRNASNDLVGFKFSVTNSASTHNETNTTSSAFWKNNGNASLGFNFIGNELSADATNTESISLIGTEFPLSLADGTWNCSLGNQSASNVWTCGLTRCTRTTDYLGNSADLTAPSYFDRSSGEFYDYVIQARDEGGVNNIIRLYHCIGDGSGQTKMEEVPYNSGTPLTTALGYTNVIWNIEAERVSCTLTHGMGISTVITGTNATSSNNAKPVNMYCRFLFPKVTLDPGKNIVMNGFDGVNVKDFVYGDASAGATSHDDWLYQDYWAHLVNIGDVSEDFEDENVNNVVGGFAGQTGLLAGRVGSVASGLRIGTEKDNNNGEVAPGDPWVGFLGSSGLSSGQALGFVDNPNPEPTNEYVVGDVIDWISSDVPKMKNTNSLFVRLKNMTFDSANMTVSNMSKMIYHIPAFSNNGESTGGLFYEPAERVYLDLHNPQEIQLTTMEVDIVNADETISKDLLGKTVICFHIKQ
tara:strand:+ start:1005 stop:2819 length:1815 start_codon:yes stop_codon:yes gene_type:complete